jgi:hypothetical protein
VTYYLTKFPPTYRNRTWWDAKSKTRAEAFLRYVEEHYKVRGKIITVFDKQTKP